MCEINRINAWLQANVSPLLATYHRKFNSHRVAKNMIKLRRNAGKNNPKYLYLQPGQKIAKAAPHFSS